MNIFLTILAVILGVIIALFVLIFFLVVKLFLEYDTDTGEFSVYAKALFIKYHIFPKKENLAKERKKALKELKSKEKKENKKKKSKKTHIFTDEELEKMNADAKDAGNNKKSASERTHHFTQLISSVTEKVKIIAPAVISAIKLEVRRLDIVVGGKDAASAAISYGAVCAAIEALLAVGRNTKKLIIRDSIFVTPDFCEEKFRAGMTLVLHIRVAKLIIPAIKILLKL